MLGYVNQDFTLEVLRWCLERCWYWSPGTVIGGGRALLPAHLEQQWGCVLARPHEHLSSRCLALNGHSLHFSFRIIICYWRGKVKILQNLLFILPLKLNLLLAKSGSCRSCSLRKWGHGLLWEKARVGWSERTALKHVYYQVWNRSPVQVGCMRQVLRAGALGWPRVMGWGGRREGGSGWGTHVNPWLIHVNVWQKPLQHCKVVSLQLIKIIGKNK